MSGYLLRPFYYFIEIEKMFAAGRTPIIHLILPAFQKLRLLSVLVFTQTGLEVLIPIWVYPNTR